MNTDQTILCIYCGERSEKTKDHVPPKCLFPKPRPANLITVPSCNKCNHGSGKDEEYFLGLFMFSDAGISNAGKKLWKEKMHRVYAKNQGLTNKLREASEYVNISTPAGIYLGKNLAITCNEKRVTKVAEKIIRGLFYFEFGESLNNATQIHSLYLNSLQKLQMANKYDHYLKLGQRQWKDVFEYKFNRIENTQGSMWIIRFFGGINFFISTIENKDG